nr:hypothetical protein CFP56_15517 [Quercus suber]
MPPMQFSIVISTMDMSTRALERAKEFVSKMASCNPMLVAKEIASSIALASASSGPSGSGRPLGLFYLPSM